MPRHHVAALSDLPENRGHEIVVDGKIVGLFRSGDTVRALDGVCPHAGGPLSTGYVSGDLVTCPWHGWQFDLNTGCHKMTPTIVQTTYKIAVEDGQVYVEIESPD